MGKLIASFMHLRPGAPVLSDRQVLVLQLMASGHHDGEIASKVGISRRTVRSYVAEIIQRFGVSTRCSAIYAGVFYGYLGWE